MRPKRERENLASNKIHATKPQIYDQPFAPLIYLNDTLFVPKGQNYKWFLNDELIGETDTNYWVPTESGIYKAEVAFREYSTYSTEKEIILTSTDSNELTDMIVIYPNPASEFINIDFLSDYSTTIQIAELTGKVIYNEIFKNTSMARIELNNFSKGVYLISVKTNNTNLTKLVTKL